MKETRNQDEKLANRLRTLGARIAYYRRLRGLSQETFSEILDYSTSYVSKIEACYDSSLPLPSLDFLYRAADALDITIADLLLEELPGENGPEQGAL